MRMTLDRLTRKEEERLYFLSSIPAVVIFFISACYYGFVHLNESYPQESFMWDFLTHFFLQVMIGAPAAAVLTFEILYQRRMKSPVKIHAKRFLSRMTLVLVSVFLLFASYVISCFFLAPLISERYAMLCSFFIWVLTLCIILSKFKRFINLLNKGY
jgi:hypothetical protein